MLMKLNNDGSVVTDENGLLKDEYYITLSNRLCGFNVTSLYIAGDYLYFTTPSKENTTENSVDPVWAKDYVEFYRITLDKSSEPERIYPAGVLYSEVSFEYYGNGNDVVILVHEKGENISDKAKLEKEDIEEDNVKNNALIRVTGSGEVSLVKNKVENYIFADNSDEIFYITNEDDEYKMYQYNIINNTSSLYVSEDSNFTVDFVSAGNVYRTFNGHLEVSKISTKSAFEVACYTTSTYTKVLVEEGVVVAVWERRVFISFRLGCWLFGWEMSFMLYDVLYCWNGFELL